jgi:basic membrane lipoprotein Med (substrate-binding protein (PBP1-ABC) superfamily)
MTPRSLLIAGLLALALVGVSQVASAAPERRVVVVVDTTAGQDPAVLAEAQAAVARSHGTAELRVTRDPTEQLSVTHYFAAQGYDLVIGVGLDQRVAVTPVAEKYPRTAFVAARPGQVARALAQER